MSSDSFITDYISNDFQDLSQRRPAQSRTKSYRELLKEVGESDTAMLLKSFGRRRVKRSA